MVSIRRHCCKNFLFTDVKNERIAYIHCTSFVNQSTENNEAKSILKRQRIAKTVLFRTVTTYWKRGLTKPIENLMRFQKIAHFRKS